GSFGAWAQGYDPCTRRANAYFSEVMNINSRVPVGILGASGYVGQELVRLLTRHPGVALVFATADASAGETLDGVTLVPVDDAPLARAEIVLSALPHGVSGRSPKRELLFGEVSEDFRAYGVGNDHRHLPELKATLAREGGFTGDLVFTPHLLPVKRGILETIHVPLTRAVDQASAERIYDAVYAAEPCVTVLRGALPSLKDVVYRNRVAIGVAAVANVRRPRVTVIAAIDNLVKGAAGQAIQNMNVMLGLPETAGLVC